MAKRKKKKRYKTGTHFSSKCKTPINYRSSWELIFCIYLDSSPNILEYEYESIKIPYISNIKTKKVRNYIPDFLVKYIDGTKALIEIKRQNKLNDKTVQKKAQAAEKWVKENGIMSYQMITEKIILPLKKIQEAYKKKPRKTKKK